MAGEHGDDLSTRCTPLHSELGLETTKEVHELRVSSEHVEVEVEGGEGVPKVQRFIIQRCARGAPYDTSHRQSKTPKLTKRLRAVRRWVLRRMDLVREDKIGRASC